MPRSGVCAAAAAGAQGAHAAARTAHASRHEGWAARIAKACHMESGGLASIAYIIIGAFVAAANHYFSHTDTIKGVVSAILAILAWPLILIGIDIRWR
jgi:sulfite exporter TauE/SafE